MLTTDSFVNYMVPQHNWEGLLLWVNEGIEPGGFLQAVLRNDLRGAFERADMINRFCIREILCWLVTEAPVGCWGSAEDYDAWKAAHSAGRAGHVNGVVYHA